MIDEIVGVSEAMRRIREIVKKMAESDIDVLILGETGVGKELVAKTIHKLSKRSSKPFIPIDCGLLPQTLAEEELFGHVRGSFTGAIDTKDGLIQTAEGGICFLDEIGDLRPELQVKLLRFLEERTVRKVGARSYERIDVRVIASTNRNLEEMVERGRFRKDLYYRLKKVVITIPPLRKRKEDIPALIRYFMKKLNCTKSLAPNVMAAFMEYDWPGNVRELKNCLENVIVLSKEDVITIENIPPNISKNLPPERGISEDRGISLKLALAEYEKLLIETALRRSNGNKSKAAKLLGISRQNLCYKIERLL